MWYYVSNQRRVGPIEDSQFEQLISEGAIGPATLVWQQGMPNWQTLAQVRGGMNVAAPPVATMVAPAGQQQCSQCGNFFPTEDLVQYQGYWVCGPCKPILFQRLREGLGAVDSGPLRYAGFWIRVVAAFIDSLVLVGALLVMLFILGLVLGVAMRPQGSRDAAVMICVGIFYLLFFAIIIGYETCFIGRCGATPGKMAVGIRVVRPDGSRVSYGRAFGRYWGRILSGMLMNIGYIIAAFDDQKRALHDHICDTRVVYKN